MADIPIDTKNTEEKQAPEEIEEMYRAGVHFGHSRSLRHPKMKQYFLDLRNNAEVFNLEKTLFFLQKAGDFLKELGSRGAKILFVSTKPEASDAVEKAGRELVLPYVTERWLGGTLTNFAAIKKRIEEFGRLREKKASGGFSELSKKEMARLERRLARMEKNFSGLDALGELPAALLVVDTKKEKAAVREARKVGIPIVAIMNSDCDPADADYLIPANDASISSVGYLLEKLTGAYKQGMKSFV